MSDLVLEQRLKGMGQALLNATLNTFPETASRLIPHSQPKAEGIFFRDEDNVFGTCTSHKTHQRNDSIPMDFYEF